MYCPATNCPYLCTSSVRPSFTMPVSLWCRRKASNCRPTSYTAARIRRFSHHQMVASSPWPSILPLLHMIRTWPHVPKAPEPPCHLTCAFRVSKLCLTVFEGGRVTNVLHLCSRATCLWTPVKVRIRDGTAGLTTWSAVFMSKLAMKAVIYL